jgi:hypothetical protein
MMYDFVQGFVNTAKTSKKYEELFAILSKTLRVLFQGEKLTLASPGTEGLQPVVHSFVQPDPFRLVRISSGHSEEIVCGAHIALHKRTPSSIEMLVCNSHTTDIDVQDFLDRWTLHTRYC